MSSALAVQVNGAGVRIVRCDERLNGFDQFRNAAECAATQSLLGDFPKPTLDHVQPRTARRNEMHVEPRMPFQPRLHTRMFMRRVVVHDHVQVQVRRRFLVNLPQELDPTPGADASPCTFRSACPRPCRLRRTAWSFRSVCNRPSSCRNGLGESAAPRCVRSNAWIEVFSSAQSTKACSGRIEIQPHNVQQLLREMRIIADLERLGSMRLKSVGLPNALYHRGRRAQRLGQGSRAPMRRVGWLFLSGFRYDGASESRSCFGRPSAARRVFFDTSQPSLGEPRAPKRNRFWERSSAIWRCPCSSFHLPRATRFWLSTPDVQAFVFRESSG